VPNSGKPSPVAMPLDLDDPTAVALTIFRALSARRIETALYGGLALAAYGEPRETRDADFAVAGLTGNAAAEALADVGARLALAMDRARFGGLLITRITLAEGGGRAGLNMVDLVEPRSPRFAAEAIERGVTGSLRGVAIRVLSPEDFVLFKLLSTRDRDVEDAATLLRAPDLPLDRAFIDAEARRLGAEIPDHDVADRLARIQPPA
jgi:Nucleotidyl transferase AbiEii toxin, Type IV TA system